MRAKGGKDSRKGKDWEDPRLKGDGASRTSAFGQTGQLCFIKGGENDMLRTRRFPSRQTCRASVGGGKKGEVSSEKRYWGQKMTHFTQANLHWPRCGIVKGYD